MIIIFIAPKIRKVRDHAPRGGKQSGAVKRRTRPMMRCRNVIAAHTLNLRRDHRRVEGDPRKLVFAGAPATDLFGTATSSHGPEQVAGPRPRRQAAVPLRLVANRNGLSPSSPPFGIAPAD